MASKLPQLNDKTLIATIEKNDPELIQKLDGFMERMGSLEKKVESLVLSPEAQSKQENYYKLFAAFRRDQQEEHEYFQRTKLDERTAKRQNTSVKRELQEESSYPKNAQSLRNLSVSGIMKDTFADMRDRAMNKFKNNKFVRFGRNIGNAYNALRGRGPMFGNETSELSQQALEEKRAGGKQMDRLVEGVEQINENLLNLKVKDPLQKKEEKGLIRTIADFFLGYKIFDVLKGLFFGGTGAIAGAGALGGIAAAIKGGGVFAGAKTTAAAMAASLGKLGLIGLVAGGIIGTVLDGLSAWGQGKEWGTSETSRLMGAFFGGNGGFLSALSRGITFAYLGAKAGAFFGPVGAVVGSLLGAALGIIGGFIGGEKIARNLDELGEWFSSTWKKFIYKLLGKPLDVALDSAIQTSNSLPKGSPLQTELDSAIDQSQQIEMSYQQADTNFRKAQEDYEENPTDENYAKVRSTLKTRDQVETKREESAEELEILTEEANVLKETSKTIESPETSKGEKRIAELTQMKIIKQKKKRQLKKELDAPPSIEPPRIKQARAYVDKNSAFFGDLGRDDDIDKKMDEEEKIIEDFETKQEGKKDKIREDYDQIGIDIKKIEDQLTFEIGAEVAKRSMPPSAQETIEKTAEERPEVVEDESVVLQEAEKQLQSATISKQTEPVVEPVEQVEQTKPVEQVEQTKPVEQVEPSVIPLSQSLLFNEAKELIRGEEVSMGDPVFEAKLDPNPTWEDGETPRYQIGYGSNFIDGKNIVEDGMKLRGFDEGDESKMKAHAEELLNKDLTRIFGEFKSKQSDNYETFQKLDPSRQIVLLSTMHQLGAAGLGKFVDSWPKIRAAVDANKEEQPRLWKIAADEMRDSIWFDEQTPNRAGRVTQVIERGGDVSWDGGVTYEASTASAAIGHMAYEPETIHVGDYKGIKNNPEVTMPMSDLEERVLSTVTKMMNIRDEASVINNNVQMMNYESRMKNLLASSEQISKRVQAKDDLESASRTMTMPPIINSAVDNSNVSTTNQSVVVNRPVENRHNPFLAIS